MSHTNFGDYALGAGMGGVSGATTGAMVGGPWGALIGGVAGTGLGALGVGLDAEAEHKKQKALEEAAEERRRAERRFNQKVGQAGAAAQEAVRQGMAVKGSADQSAVQNAISEAERQADRNGLIGSEKAAFVAAARQRVEQARAASSPAVYQQALGGARQEMGLATQRAAIPYQAAQRKYEGDIRTIHAQETGSASGAIGQAMGAAGQAAMLMRLLGSSRGAAGAGAAAAGAGAGGAAAAGGAGGAGAGGGGAAYSTGRTAAPTTTPVATTTTAPTAAKLGGTQPAPTTPTAPATPLGGAPISPGVSSAEFRRDPNAPLFKGSTFHEDYDPGAPVTAADLAVQPPPGEQTYGEYGLTTSEYQDLSNQQIAGTGSAFGAGGSDQAAALNAAPSSGEIFPVEEVDDLGLGTRTYQTPSMLGGESGVDTVSPAQQVSYGQFEDVGVTGGAQGTTAPLSGQSTYLGTPVGQPSVVVEPPLTSPWQVRYREPALASGGIAGTQGPEVAILGEEGPELVLNAKQTEELAGALGGAQAYREGGVAGTKKKKKLPGYAEGGVAGVSAQPRQVGDPNNPFGATNAGDENAPGHDGVMPKKSYEELDAYIAQLNYLFDDEEEENLELMPGALS